MPFKPNLLKLFRAATRLFCPFRQTNPFLTALILDNVDYYKYEKLKLQILGVKCENYFGLPFSLFWFLVMTKFRKREDARYLT
jgi:hypothetical protein